MAKVTILPEDSDIEWSSWSKHPENGGFWDERNWLAKPSTPWEALIEENFALADLIATLFMRDFQEGFVFAAEELKRESEHIIQEPIVLSELNEKFLARAFAEAFKLKYRVDKTIGVEKTAKIIFKPEIRFDVHHKEFEDLIIAELNKRTLEWIRKYNEAFGVKQYKVFKDIESNKLAEIWFDDVVKDTIRGVLSDLFFQEGVWDIYSLDKFVRNGGRHVGYTTFKEFITGDYEYRQALFRLAMESKTADRALVEEIDIAIDVDDVYDRGTATVTDKNYGANVQFSRVFAIAPEITITMRTGSALKAIRPEVFSVSTTGFTARLYDVEGNLTTGTFTWLAAGY